MPDMNLLTGEIHWRGESGYEEARCGRVFNARRPERYPAAVLFARVRRRRRRGRPARTRAGTEGDCPRGRAQLGGLEPARRGAADRPRTHAGAHIRRGDRDRDGEAGGQGRGGADAVPDQRTAARSPAGTARASGSAAFCCREGRAGTRARTAGPARTSSRSTSSPPTASSSTPTSTENSDLLWAARGAGPGFFGVVTRFHLRTYPLVGVDDAGHLDVRARGSRTARSPGSTSSSRASIASSSRSSPRRGCRVRTARRSCCCTRPRCARPRRRPSGCSRRSQPARSPIAQSGTIGVARRSRRRTRLQAAQNPEDHRYAVDCTWTDACAGELVPLLADLYAELPTEHSFSIWYGWSPEQPAARHGLLDRGARLPRDVRDLEGPRRRRATPGLGARPHPSGWRRSARASTSATPTSVAARIAFWRPRTTRGCRRSAPAATRTDASAST